VSAPSTATPLPDGSKVKLAVVTGLRVGKSYALKEGATYIGRMGPQPVDVDLSEQENPGVSVQVNRFALVWNDKNGLGIADTGRGVTSVNGVRIASGKRFPLKADDSVQIGKTVLQVKVILKKRTAAQK
jgi:predicted component of type VI protein secretion system